MKSHTVEARTVDSMPLAVVRRLTSAHNLARIVPECCGLVWEVLRAQGVRGGRHVAVYSDSSIRLEVGVELFGPFAETREVVRSATPAGTVACATHLGPYSALGAAHDAVRRWCRTHNRRPAGPVWEIYGHWQPDWNADPSQIRTDVYHLISD